MATDPALLDYLRNSNVKLAPERDGDIYRIVRHFDSIGDERLISKWKSKTNGSKARFFKGIGPALTSCIARHYPIYGLWVHFSLGCN